MSIREDLLYMLLPEGSASNLTFDYIVSDTVAYYDLPLGGTYHAVLGLLPTTYRSIEDNYTYYSQAAIDNVKYMYMFPCPALYGIVIVYNGDVPVYAKADFMTSYTRMFDGVNLADIYNADMEKVDYIAYYHTRTDLASFAVGEPEITQELMPVMGSYGFYGRYKGDIAVPYTYFQTKYTYTPPESYAGVGEVSETKRTAESGSLTFTEFNITINDGEATTIYTNLSQEELVAENLKIIEAVDIDNGLEFRKPQLISPIN